MFFKRIIIILSCAVCLLALPLASAEIHEAAHSGNLERVKALLESQPELLEARADNGGTPLHYAAYGIQIEMMDFLLKKGADINAKDNERDTPLVWVVANGKKDSAVYLLEKGADISLTDSSRFWLRAVPIPALRVLLKEPRISWGQSFTLCLAVSIWEANQRKSSIPLLVTFKSWESRNAAPLTVPATRRSVCLKKLTGIIISP